MKHLVKLLRDSYDLQEEKSEESAYWHLQQLRSEIKQLTFTNVVKSLPSKEEILLQARKIENYIGDEMPIVGAEKSGKFHGFLEGVEWLSSRQK